MSRFNIFVLCSVLLSIQHASTLSQEDAVKMYQEILPHLTECSKEFSTTPEQIHKDGEAGSLDGCLIKCVLKRIEIIDDKGLFNVEKAVEQTKQKFTNPDEQKAVEVIINKCSSVNDQAVSDGEEGCERAKLLMECAKPFKSQFLPGV